MAAISFALSCICGSYSRYAISLLSSPDPYSLSIPSTPSHFPMIRRVVSSPSFLRRTTIISTSAAVSEALTPAEDDETPPTQTGEQTVSVAVSPSDILTMFFWLGRGLHVPEPLRGCAIK